MMQLVLITMMTMNTFLFTQTNHPMTMGLILLAQTLLTCAMTGLMTKSFWFSYMLFLIFIGGMLILFIYMSSLASNEKIKTSWSFMKWYAILISSIILMMILDKFYLNNFFHNYEMMSFFNWENLMNENSISLTKMYDKPNNLIIMLLINYLLLTLIVVVKITNSFMGPLRPKNY